MKKGVLLLLAVVLVLPVVLFACLKLTESVTVHRATVEYAALDDGDKADVPPFATSIHSATYSDWQVGEWAWRFDLPADDEAALREWVAGKGGRPLDVSQARGIYHMKPPAWWAMPPDARLVSHRDIGQGRSMSIWCSRTENRVWILYRR
jgi:hypothetical protein